MKHALFSICLVLCFFVAGAMADKTQTFGMKNSNGDSAICKMTSPKETAEERNKQFKEGEKTRRQFFNDDGFKKVIENTKEGKQFDVVGTPYEKMKDCQLVFKSEPSEPEEDQASTPPSIDVSTESSQNQKSRSKKTSSNQAPDVQEKEEEQMSRDTFENTTERTERKPIPKSYIVIVALFFVVIVVFLLSRKRNTVDEEFRNIKSFGEFDKSGIGAVADPKDAVVVENDKDRRLAELESKVQFLTESLNKQNTTVAKLEPDTAHEPAIDVAPKKDKVPIDTFFFAGPIENTFDASRKTDNFVDGKSLYKFEQVHGSNRAAFVVVDGYESVVQRFIYSPELQVGVCDVIGNYNPNASRIQTDESGEAVLDGDTWVVGKKAKIRYC